MCGLAGIIAQTHREDAGAIARDLAARLRHRGPDSAGFWMVRGDQAGLADEHELAGPSSVVLAHRRLSIVDLAAGLQPMSNEDDTVWVTFNGEIYNHAELRTTLERVGHVFTTRSDTEVLVHGWEEWGERLFGKLNGIFAVALFDRRHDELVLARDPVGVKPLYVGSNGDATWWASELSAAIGAGVARAPISVEALRLFFTFRFIPAPTTVLEDVWKLPPGHFARIAREHAGSAPSFRPFVCEVHSPAEPRSRDEWQEAVMAGLADSVRRQLMSDVPVASLLSGGVDSTLVSQLMKRMLPYAPHTFGIGFPSDGPLNEALASQRAADALGTVHHSILVDDADYRAAWPGMFSYVGEPIANVGGLLVQLLCEQVGRDNKVVLTGQGADEPLGGYPRHVVERIYPWARHAPRLVPRLARSLLGTDTGNRLARALSAPERVDRYVDTLSVLPSWQVDELIPGDGTPTRELAREAVSRWIEPQEPDDTLNELLRLETRFSLADDLLVIADHFSMRSSVELRVPFLDLELLDLLERMPSRYKVSAAGGRKWLYRRGAAKELPPALQPSLTGGRARFGRKRGFNAPVTAWFDGGGPIGTGAEWREGLARCPAISTEAASRVASEADDSQNARKRVTLYALSQWLAEGPLTRDDPDRVPVASQASG